MKVIHPIEIYKGKKHINKNVLAVAEIFQPLRVLQNQYVIDKNANNLPKMLQHRKNKKKSFAALTCRTQPVPARGAQQGWL